MATESAPDRDPSAEPDPRIVRRNRRMLLTIVGIAVGTYLAAWLFQPFAVDLLGVSNNGEFVDPAVQMDDIFGDRLPKGRFYLLFIPPADCTGSCAAGLGNVRGIQVLLAKDASRVRRVVADVNGALASRAALQAQFPKLIVLAVPQTPPALTPAAYIVDPAGRAILRYDFGDTGKPMLEDLRRLLKTSRTG